MTSAVQGAFTIAPKYSFPGARKKRAHEKGHFG